MNDKKECYPNETPVMVSKAVADFLDFIVPLAWGETTYPGDIQEKAIELGLLNEVEVYEPCDRDNCACLDYYSEKEFAAGEVLCCRKNWEVENEIS